MSTSSLTRRLAAIMSIDVVSYSKMMGEDEEGTLKLLNTHRAYIDNSIRNNDGRVANTAGDSVLAEFASPVRAIRCAVEIQDSVEKLNAKLPADRHMRLRVGVHVDDIIVQPNGDLIGEGVNIAARLQSAVEPGGVGVSGEVVAQTRAKLADVSFVPMGDATLKNILRAIEPFRLVKDPGTRGRTALGVTLGPGTPRPVTPAPGRPFMARWGLAIALCLCLAAAGGVAGYFALRESPSVALERAAWAKLSDSRSLAEIEAFLEKHPNGANGAEARSRLATLRAEEEERVTRERALREEAERLAREKARAEAQTEAEAQRQREEARRQREEAHRQREEEARAAETTRAAEAARAAAERRRREDMERAEVRRQAAAQRRERRLEATRKLEFKPVACLQSRFANAIGLSCTVSPTYDGVDGKGRFRRWTANSPGDGDMATYVVLVEAIDAVSVHDPVTLDDEEAMLAEIGNVTRHNAMRWSDIEASASGFVARFVTFDQRNCAAFSKPGPARGPGLAWVLRGYLCAAGGQALSAERIRAVLDAQKVN